MALVIVPLVFLLQPEVAVEEEGGRGALGGLAEVPVVGLVDAGEVAAYNPLLLLSQPL